MPVPVNNGAARICPKLLDRQHDPFERLLLGFLSEEAMCPLSADHRDMVRAVHAEIPCITVSTA
ncbi:hypothetical protein [Sciscionella marina]|uniref:hypothetical protein n=1 Tax=Sciscionella marina TaxID=508770 RepID=UPI000364540E|nr:hypothetical protein [Sciscionella marina]